MAKQVSVDAVNKQLDDLVNKRKADKPHLPCTKQGVVAELVLKAHKRECK